MPVLSLLQSRRKTRRGKKKKLKKRHVPRVTILLCIYTIYIYIWPLRKETPSCTLDLDWMRQQFGPDGIFLKRICNRRDDDIVYRIERWLCNRIAAKIIYHDSSDLSTIHANQSTYRILTNDCARFRFTDEMVKWIADEISFRPRYGDNEITKRKIIVQRGKKLIDPSSFISSCNCI